MSKKAFRSVMFVFILLFVPGCMMLKSRMAIRDCQFRIVDVSVEYSPLRDVDKLNLTFKIECKNPNKGIEAILDKLDFTLYINEQKAASGAVANIAKIPPVSTVQFPLSVELLFSQVGKTIFNIINSGKTDYELKGTVFLSTPIGKKAFPVTIAKGKWSDE